MLNQDMPLGKPIQFEGDISKTIKDPFGFFEVSAPLELKIPILQIRVKLNGIFKTISPVGSWINTHFSEEIKEAKKLGYKFKILRGYLFEKENIFKEFILDLSEIKENSSKGSANYTIFKLLMNSLYGRFGMSPKMETHKIIDQSLALKYHTEDNYVVTSFDLLLNGKELISFFDINERYDNIKKINISVPIASAITSYPRIYMSKFKIMMGDNLYYSDTDSLYTSKELNEKYIDQKKIRKIQVGKSI
jgi:DNA polymerase type B, organellar and viral